MKKLSSDCVWLLRHVRRWLCSPRTFRLFVAIFRIVMDVVKLVFLLISVFQKFHD
jgi:hypothetical protein